LRGCAATGSTRQVCREHEISETLYYSWHDKLLEGGRAALAEEEEQTGDRELKRKIRELARALGRKTDELEIAGKSLRGWGVSERVARSPELVAPGLRLALGVRVLQGTRRAIYRVPGPRRPPDGERRLPADEVEGAIV